MKAFDIIEAFDSGEHSDISHPSIKRSLERSDHPLANNPAFPDYHLNSNHAEYTASEQYKDLVVKFTRHYNAAFNKTASFGKGQEAALSRAIHESMGAALRNIVGRESPHKDHLAKLAVKLVMEQPELKHYREAYKNGEFRIEAILGVEGKVDTVRPNEVEDDEDDDNGVDSSSFYSDDDDDDDLSDDLSDEDDDLSDEDDDGDDGDDGDGGEFEGEVHKRHLINIFIQGGALNKNFAHAMFSEELKIVGEDIVKWYNLAMSGSMLWYYTIEQDLTSFGMAPLGSVEIDSEDSEDSGGDNGGGDDGGGDDGGHVYVIKARAKIFPILVQEIMKGVMEMTSHSALPSDTGLKKRVLNKTDFVDYEKWAIIVGNKMWNDLISHLDIKESDLALYLYHKLIHYPHREFSTYAKILLEGGGKAKSLVKKWVEEIRRDYFDNGGNDDKIEPPSGGYNGDNDDDDDDDDGFLSTNWKD